MPPAAKDRKEKGKARTGYTQYKPGKQDCAYCRRDLAGEVRIECAECRNPRLEFCVDCFNVGVEIRGHKRNHAYKVLDIIRVPLLSHEWGAHEELRLLEALQLYGFGNWHDIASHVGNKSHEECERHYRRFYLNSPTFPVPDFSKPPQPATPTTTLVVAAAPVATAGAASATDAAGATEVQAQQDSGRQLEDGAKLEAGPSASAAAAPSTAPPPAADGTASSAASLLLASSTAPAPTASVAPAGVAPATAPAAAAAATATSASAASASAAPASAASAGPADSGAVAGLAGAHASADASDAGASTNAASSAAAAAADSDAASAAISSPSAAEDQPPAAAADAAALALVDARAAVASAAAVVTPTSSSPTATVVAVRATLAASAGPRPSVGSHAGATVLASPVAAPTGVAAATAVAAPAAATPSSGAHDFAAYMPLRGEFDVEWEDDAEQLIADMEFSASDGEAERGAKLQLLRAYNHTLDERQRRRDFVIHNDMFTPLRRQLDGDRQASAAERALRSGMRPFGRFHSDAQHEALIASMMQEAELVERVEHLDKCHASGIHSLQECNNQRHINQPQTTHPTGASLGKGAAGLGKGNGMRRGAGLGKMGRGSWLGKGAMRSEASTSKRAAPEASSSLPEGGSHAKAIASASKRLRKAEPDAAPLLSADEELFCESNHLQPALFVRSKRQLLLEAMRCGPLSHDQAVAALRSVLDAPRGRLLWEHLVQNGLIPALQ